ncbi:MAG: hypothetical protein GZ094_19435 [Mariniphaga sp.]|nr:hypothetical protein [Mariniphaga sp.]
MKTNELVIDRPNIIDSECNNTGIQARLCWETLLVEIEAYAICKKK